MIIGVDASNIRRGGGVTHLVELLRSANPSEFGFDKVVVWACRAVLAQLEDRPWLAKRFDPPLEGHYLRRALWQYRRLGVLARQEGCDLLFVPGGTFKTNFRPVVTMSQNMLPFDWRELRRYGRSLYSLKLMILRQAQKHSFRRADGLIFLTHFAHDTIMRVIKSTGSKTATIPHGIDERFLCPPRDQLPISHYSVKQPFRILYVSIIDVYKHQWHAAEAVSQLRNEGLPVVLDLVGPAYSPALKRLKKTLNRIDPEGAFVKYAGAVPYDELHEWYNSADLFLFASSCENMPNILLEGMASGKPIACSNKGPMPEVLGDAGVYFDPLKVDDISSALHKLISSPILRSRLSAASFKRAQAFSWQRCADETFGFLVNVAKTDSKNNVSHER